jgi:hypothetical protein
MIAPGATRRGLPSIIRGGQRGDDQPVVAPGGVPGNRRFRWMRVDEFAWTPLAFPTYTGNLAYAAADATHLPFRRQPSRLESKPRCMGSAELFGRSTSFPPIMGDGNTREEHG